MYEGPSSEQLPVVVPLLVSGLHDDWRCLYIGPPDTLDMMRAALANAGVDLAREIETGALVLSSDREHLASGAFDPQAMIDGLSASIDEAVRDGYRGLCATGDMRWELGADENFGRLLEYEARLEQLFRHKPLRGICQYHRDRLPARAIRDALVTHRSTYVGRRLDRDNVFYMPPELHLAPADTADASQGEWMRQQIIRVLDAEIERDAERTAELERARAAVDAANAAKTEFLASMSHELRTPLNAVLGFAQLLECDKRSPLDERQRERLSHVLRGGEHLLRLIDDVLDLSRIEARRITVSCEAVNASEVLAEVIATLEPMAARAQIEIVSAGVVERPQVFADRARLAQILMNFGSNAIKYGKPGGHVSFAFARYDPATVRIIVVDDGIGIPIEKHDNVFEPFHRAGQETGPIEGTGIGLTITKRLAELMGGRVGFTSEVGRGSEFWVEIPAHDLKKRVKLP